MCVLIWLENTNKGGDTMFDYWVSEVIAERVYQVNEVYFDAGNIIPSVVMPNCYCIKSKNVAHNATGYGGELMVEEELIC